MNFNDILYQMTPEDVAETRAQLDALARSGNPFFEEMHRVFTSALAERERSVERLAVQNLLRAWPDLEGRKRNLAFMSNELFAYRSDLSAPPLEMRLYKGTLDGPVLLDGGVGDILMATNYILETHPDPKTDVYVAHAYVDLATLLLPDCTVHTSSQTLPDWAYLAQDIFLSAPQKPSLGTHPSLQPMLGAPGAKSVIGLQWRGGTKGVNERSLPLTDLAKHLCQGERYVVLQRDMHPNEARHLSEIAHQTGCKIQGCGFDLTDHRRLLTSMAISLKSVISVDGTALHLAGQLGVPAKMIGPKGNSGWHWFNERWDLAAVYPDLRYVD